MLLKAPIAQPVRGANVGLLMPDGTPVPNVKSVRMVYEPNGLPICVVELYGVEVVHVDNKAE